MDTITSFATGNGNGRTDSDDSADETGNGFGANKVNSDDSK